MQMLTGAIAYCLRQGHSKGKHDYAFLKLMERSTKLPYVICGRRKTSSMFNRGASCNQGERNSSDAGPH